MQKSTAFKLAFADLGSREPDVHKQQEADKNINAWLIENKLYLSHREDWKKRPRNIRKGQKVYRLNEMEIPPTRESLRGQGNAAFPLEPKHLQFAIVRGNKDIPLSAGINKIENFVIRGKQTIHINLAERPEPCAVQIAKDIEIKPDSGNNLVLKAKLGMHRGQGRLVAEITQDGRTTRREIKFSKDHIGGKASHRYRKATIKLPRIKSTAKLNILVKHEQFIEWEESESLSTYYFICDLKIAREDGKPLHRITPRIKEGTQALPNTDRIMTAIVEPFRGAHDSPLEIEWADDTTTKLFEPLQTTAKIFGTSESGVITATAKDGLYNLYINGQLATTEYLTEQSGELFIHSDFLRGEPALIELRDQSGSQIIASSTQMLRRSLTPEDVLYSESKPPYPTDLTIRSGHRFQSIRKHLESPLPGTDSKMLSQALETLEGNYETVKLKYLDIPTQRNPKASIIIPAHNKVEATYYCICSILAAYNTTAYEIIVVDDGSSDDTSRIEDIISGIKVVRNKEPQRFIKACNSGASQAKGDYIVLLNNDTEVTNGWLDALIQAFTRFDNVGAVGSTLLYPDGTLQGAGGIVWGSGNPWNYGTGHNAFDPRFTYARQVDYICGAALMTPRAVWEKVRGLSDYLEPMYFEDTDYSFKVREAGYKTYFIPSSIVYHHEGLTSGTDTSSGFKRFQEVNRPKFKKQWNHAFLHNGREGFHPDLEKDREIVGRVLFIDYATPREDRDAGSYAALQEIKLVQSLGYKVTFLPKDLCDLGSYSQTLRDMGVEVITTPFYLSVEDFIAHRGDEFNCAYITRYYVAQESIPALRQYAPDCKIILNNADLHFLRELRGAGRDPEKLEKAEEVRELELEMMTQVDVVLSYNDTEHAVIQSHTENAVKVRKCPWVVDIPSTFPKFEQTKGLAFLGGFQHPPNREGIEWFAAEVMPSIRQHGIELSVYGAGMDDDLKASLKQQGINAVGYIEHLEDLYLNHRIFIAPLLSGAGIKGKVINALAYGIPTILSPIAAEGIGLRHGHDCLIAKSPHEWAEAITNLNINERYWNSISKASREYAQQQFSFTEGRRLMRETFEAIDLFNIQN